MNTLVACVFVYFILSAAHGGSLRGKRVQPSFESFLLLSCTLMGEAGGQPTGAASEKGGDLALLIHAHGESKWAGAQRCSGRGGPSVPLALFFVSSCRRAASRRCFGERRRPGPFDSLSWRGGGQPRCSFSAILYCLGPPPVITSLQFYSGLYFRPPAMFCLNFPYVFPSDVFFQKTSQSLY